MTGNDTIQILLYLAVLLACVRPLGGYMARVYMGERVRLERVLGPVERLFYRSAGIDEAREMGWKEYTAAVLAFSLGGFVLLYCILRWQSHFPLNPAGMTDLTPHLAFDTAVSFVTNTNWQSYGGESTLSYFSQMVGLTMQNFASAAAGMAVMAALIRGLARRKASTIGNFWVDLTRTNLYILLPLALIWTVLLGSQGVVQTFGNYLTVPADGSAAGRRGQGRFGQSHHAPPRPSPSRPSPSAPPRRRSPSSSSVPTAAASSTPTPRIRSRTRRPSPTSSKCWRS